MEKKRLPVGIDDFTKIRNGNYYYVDKSLLIKDIIKAGSEVTLFTRPRRFGKSLNMSMLKNFFSVNGDKAIFDGLEISKDKDFCDKYMGKYPVISISLKNVEGISFEGAKDAFKLIIGNLASEFKFLRKDNLLDEEEIEKYNQLIAVGGPGDKVYTMSDNALRGSLHLLSVLLSKYYGTKTVILIDEYDVPLDKAHDNGYYDEMVELIRGMFGAALKTNENLEFAVLTGCLRISKESIFTGLNNFDVRSITNIEYNEYFGFTEDEVAEILDYYELSSRAEDVKEWYDGYKFADKDIYCPWDVLKFCSEAVVQPDILPMDYWSNSSGNKIVRDFVKLATGATVSEIEKLVAGETIKKKIREDLTYRDINNDIDNLWSVLFSTGYLTGTVEGASRIYDLYIPNLEVHDLFVDQISTWFESKVRRDTSSAEKFYNAAVTGDCAVMEKVLCRILGKSISIRDTFVSKDLRENFYHGFLLGLLQSYPEVYSNRESGNGFSDIMIVDDDSDTAAILELKYSDKDTLKAMENSCREALDQIKRMKYDENPRLRVVDRIRKYGISFNRKIACVRIE